MTFSFNTPVKNLVINGLRDRRRIISESVARMFVEYGVIGVVLVVSFVMTFSLIVGLGLSVSTQTSSASVCTSGVVSDDLSIGLGKYGSWVILLAIGLVSLIAGYVLHQKGLRTSRILLMLSIVIIVPMSFGISILGFDGLTSNDKNDNILAEDLRFECLDN
jgi:hypothetical protein